MFWSQDVISYACLDKKNTLYFQMYYFTLLKMEYQVYNKIHECDIIAKIWIRS